MNKLKHLSICLLIALLGLFTYAAPKLCIVKNISESLPFSYFLALPIKDVRLGNYVLFDHPNELIVVAKKVAGLPGDEIKIRAGILYINEQRVGKIQTKSSSGLELQPISQGRIDNDFIFVVGTHPFSFDSRYSDFGLIPLSNVRKQLWPIF